MRLADRLAETKTFTTFDKPQGTPRNDWPAWAKRPRPDSQHARVPGCVQFIGDSPYEELTPRNEAYGDFVVTQQEASLKSRSIREGVRRYIPPHAFEVWVRHFVTHLDWPGSQQAVHQSLTHIYDQFNPQKPGLSFPEGIVRTKIEEKYQSLCRAYLELSDTRGRVPEHIDLVLALALYQAAHRPYLESLKGEFGIMLMHRELEKEELGNALAVIEGPLSALTLSFPIYKTLLPLTILKRDEVIAKHGPGPEPELTTQAITEAWQFFVKKRLLRTKFENFSMTCPANEHLRNAIETRLIERLYRFVIKNRREQVIQELGASALRIIDSALHRPMYHYLRSKAANALFDPNIRGGKGLELKVFAGRAAARMH